MNTKRILNDIVDLLEEIFTELRGNGARPNKDWEEQVKYDTYIQKRIDFIRQDLEEN